MGVLSFIPFLLSQGFFRRQSKPVQAFGPHSFKSLGSSFYVEVPVRRVPGARLVLFNRRLAESLDLPVPKGGREIESALLEWFAWFKHESRAGEGDTPAEDIETFFATRYQDSDSRCAGSALGDGRALWLGEIVRKTADDRMRYLDVVVKGIGATPLAWLKHPKKSHRDGMVGLTEAVHEYVYSLAAVRNGIDAAQVLAVIELPFQRAAGGEKAALVVRVGNHLRFAHYRYFSNQPERLETLFEYGLKRDMGLPLDYPVGRQDARAYLDRILAHLAEEAAAYYDLHAVHGSPTFGNRTSDGASIDLSTFVYLDAHHAEYRYMPGCSYSLGGRWGQHEQLFVLFSDLMKLLRGSRFKYADTVEDEKRCWEKFRSVMESRLTQSWLKRVGLAESDIAALSADAKRRFFEVVKAIYEARGGKKIKLKKGRTYLAAFEPRRILALTACYYGQFDDVEQLWERLFRVRRNWQTLAFEQARPFIQAYVQAYVQAVRQLVAELDGSGEIVARWRDCAQVTQLSDRREPGPDFFYDSERFLSTQSVLARIRQGESGWEENSRAADEAAGRLVDEGLAFGVAQRE